MNVFVQNLEKYNDDEIKGEWLQLPTNQENIDRFLKEKVCSTPTTDEYIISDITTTLDCLKSVAEHANLEQLNLLAAYEQKADNIEAINAYCQHDGICSPLEICNVIAQEKNLNIIPVPEHCSPFDSENAIIGYAFAEINNLEEKFNKANLSDIFYYFDYESYGRDIAINNKCVLVNESILNISTSEINTRLYSQDELSRNELIQKNFDERRTVKQLSKDELTELKQQYFLNKNNGSFDTSYVELAAIDELVTDQEVYNAYSDTLFVKDDFSCNQNDYLNESIVKMTHNEYEEHKKKIQDRFDHGITNNDDLISLKNIHVTDFDLSKYNLTDDMKKVINTCFLENDFDKSENEHFHGRCNKQNIDKLIAKPLNCKIGCDCGHAGIYYNPENRIILEFVENTMTLSVFENDEKYNKFSHGIKQYYNQYYGTNLKDYDLSDKPQSVKTTPTIQTQPINKPKPRRL